MGEVQQPRPVAGRCIGEYHGRRQLVGDLDAVAVSGDQLVGQVPGPATVVQFEIQAKFALRIHGIVTGEFRELAVIREAGGDHSGFDVTGVLDT